jgi:hypothetical protein
MADQPQQLSAIDPDNVPEILCDGMFNVSVAGNLATLTFTHGAQRLPRCSGKALWRQLPSYEPAL